MIQQCGRIPFQPEDKQTPPPGPATVTPITSQLGHITQSPGKTCAGFSVSISLSVSVFVFVSVSDSVSVSVSVFNFISSVRVNN